jgi:hypothetical protein
MVLLEGVLYVEVNFTGHSPGKKRVFIFLFSFLGRSVLNAEHTDWNILNHTAFRMKTINICTVPHARRLIVPVPLCTTYNRGTVDYFPKELS